MNIKNNLLELIGNTPLVYLHKIKKDLNLYANIIVKLESFNPLSSIKDRTAYALIKGAIANNLINNDTVIVEATSGNTGIGLSYICAILNIKLIIVMPKSASLERRKIITSLGAEIILSDSELGMSGAIKIASALIANNKNYLSLNQFENSANPIYHYQTTAQEILNDTDGNITYFVAGIGTGGTFSGVAKLLKEKIPNIKTVAIEPLDSAVLTGNIPKINKIEGLGAGFIPKNLDLSLVDEVIDVSLENALFGARLLAKTEGILAGFSSGAALFGAIKIAQKKENANKNIIVILPDTGERYLFTELFENV